jgi:hypothetical protein
LLKGIEDNYQLGSQIIGNEPYIYQLFGVEPAPEEPGSVSDLSSSRKDIFSGQQAKKSTFKQP